MGVTLPSLKERGPTEGLSSRKAETDQGTTVADRGRGNFGRVSARQAPVGSLWEARQHKPHADPQLESPTQNPEEP